ncbi:hypothetical protein LJR039_007557 [Pseudorhodoferax sp. LjRoot39]|uniref:hypothetical protein n=1 Tax=Pseudorhodoferax sp. LjRoot39 TaxID=3342328 RepID=UPI003ED0EC5A
MIKKIVAIFATVFAFSGHIQAATIQLFSSSQYVSGGALFNIDIRVIDIIDAGAPSLGVFDIDIGFDPLIASYQGITWGSGLDILGLGSLQIATPGAGTINLFELSLDSIADLNDLQPSAFKLATLTFLAQAAGSTWFSVSPNSVGDAEGMNLELFVGNPVNVTVNSAVPEPQILLLFWLGLAAFFITTRVRKLRPIQDLE